MNAVPTAPEDPSPESMKAFNRKFVTGVTVVTTMDGDTPRGLAVNAYCSISLEPPLVMVCVQSSSATYPALFTSDYLGINILGAQQTDVVATFATKAADKFANLEWRPGVHGSPLITGAAASLEAEIRERFQARTHSIFICRVRQATAGAADPMVYSDGRFYDGSQLVPLEM